ncbi:MAG: PAS domain S-box protein [Archangium sp.]|nr:PAS domain S-box protein [Archangium sp.]
MRERSRQESFAPFFSLSGDFLLVLTPDLEVLLANPAFTSAHGTATSPVTGRSMLDFVVPKDRKKVSDVLGALHEGASRSLDASLIRRDQSLRSCEWSVAVEHLTQHRYVVIRDMTTRRRLEQELINAHKLEAVGQLASGIAHEINTPVQFIGNNLSFLGEVTGELFAAIDALSPEVKAQVKAAYPDLDYARTEMPRSIEQSSEGCQRVAEIVRGMKEFAHHDRGELTTADLNDAIDRTLAVSRNEWKYAADVERTGQPLPLVPCVASSIRQVLLNLVCNAAHAIESRNKRTGRKKGHIVINTAVEGQSALISVSDDGEGMPATVKQRVFEPFFTTKPVGRGTGQGLALSRTIVVEKHGGQLSFDSTEGEGTTFTIRLPLSVKQARAS